MCGESSDGSYEVIEKYKDFLKNYIIEKDDGIYFAMNKALDFCEGNYINFLNAGDTLTCAFTLEKVKSTIEQNTDVLCGSIYNIDQCNNRYLIKTKTINQPLDGMFCCHQAIICREHVLKRFKFDTQFKVSADYHWALKCFYHGYKFQFSELPIVDFKEGGFSYKNKILRTVENMFIQSKYFDRIESIFTTNTFASFLSYKSSNNILFSRLFNDLKIQFERLMPKHDSFVLYGFGNIGRVLFHFYSDYFDKIYDRDSFNLSKKHGIDIYSPDGIQIEKEVLVVVSCLGYEHEVTNYLETKGLNKIFCFDI